MLSRVTYTTQMSTTTLITMTLPLIEIVAWRMWLGMPSVTLSRAALAQQLFIVMLTWLSRQNISHHQEYDSNIETDQDHLFRAHQQWVLQQQLWLWHQTWQGGCMVNAAWWTACWSATISSWEAGMMEFYNRRELSDWKTGTVSSLYEGTEEKDQPRDIKVPRRVGSNVASSDKMNESSKGKGDSAMVMWKMKLRD